MLGHFRLEHQLKNGADLLQRKMSPDVASIVPEWKLTVTESGSQTTAIRERMENADIEIRFDPTI